LSKKKTPSVKGLQKKYGRPTASKLRDGFRRGGVKILKPVKKGKTRAEEGGTREGAKKLG